MVLLGKVSRKLGWRCVAYCLMTNHVHLVMNVPAFTISRGMQLLNGQYAQAFNRRLVKHAAQDFSEFSIRA